MKMQPSELEILLTDFGKISRRASEVRTRRDEADRGKRNPEESMAYAMALHDLRFVEGGLVWYGGAEGFMSKVHIGKPEDYLEIRDNFDRLKEFLGKTLDRGRLCAGKDRDTNTADYIAWMHRYSQHLPFRGNLERATVELLKGEFNRTFEPYPTFYQKAMERELEEVRRNKLYNNDALEAAALIWGFRSLRDALLRNGLNRVDTEDERAFRELFIRELTPTLRPPIFEEYAVHKHGQNWQKEEQKLREKYTSEGHDKTPVVHMKETSLEFQEAYKQRYLKRNADRIAIREFAPQFNRLVGLLDVVSFVGKPDNGFVEAHDVLTQKAREGFMRDAPTILYELSGARANIYHSILLALSGIQRSDELRDLWLQNIREDNRVERVVASVHGLFNAYKTKRGRREQIPAVLAKLQERGYDLDQTRQYTTAIGFLDEVNFLDNVVQHLVQMSYGRGRFKHLDKESTSLDILNKKNTEDSKYHFVFTRYTPAGRQVLRATYDLRTDAVQGDAQLEKTVRAYFENGYEIGNKVVVTSLEGRKITGNEAEIVEVGDQNVDGLYEGLIGLNHTPFPFLYDATSGAVLLAEPFDSRTVMFGVRGGWAERRAGLEKITAKIPYDKFQPISQFTQRVNELVQEKKKHGYLGDALYSLSGRLSDEVASPLSLVISARLVNARDGLVQ